MARYVDYWNELMSWVPLLDPFMAKRFVNRAWRDIQDTRPWSFNLVESTLTSADLVNAGTVTVNQDNVSVTGDATADAVWGGIGNLPLSSRQFRIGSGPIYNITNYAAAALTLDRPYAETSASGSAYELYKCYYDPPANDFLRFVSVVDPINGFPLITDETKAGLDRIDPKRGARGLPYRIGSYKVNPAYAAGPTFAGYVKFEMWPHPTGRITYTVLYQRRGIDFISDTATLPVSIRDETLIERAKYDAYEWAMANAVAHKDLRGIAWMDLIKKSKAAYEENLNQDIRQDEETFQMITAGNYVFNFRGNAHLAHLPQFGPWFGSGYGYPY